VKTAEQFVDILTKGVSSSTFHAILSKLGMLDIFAQLERECRCVYFMLFHYYNIEEI
jgi:hypothetical protein